MESEPLDKPGRFWTMYGAIIAVILFVGWKQPLRYRFMSKADIDAIEHPATPTPPPATPRALRAAATPPSLVNPNYVNPLNRH